ncbi:tumor protein D52 isoform X1 [Episyrphus balteatus]|uniref:tumor protein D52 isoform X1 n=1 Tax=Episyrphus balteatus TaxID=286459 RepID=UPI002485BE86|nr:tumor protein D52 isoform X1 [Episyrphus balteatus]
MSVIYPTTKSTTTNSVIDDDDNDNEPVSLEFIEDPYIPKLDNCLTPSLDEITDYDDQSNIIIDANGNSNSAASICDWSEETEMYLRNLTLDQIFYDAHSDFDSLVEYQMAEAEFGIKHQSATNNTTTTASQPHQMSIAKRFRLKFLTKRTMRDVKVTFIDFSKPYLAKISGSENYKKFLNIGSPTTATGTTTTTLMSDNTQKMSEPASPASVASADIAAEFAALTVEEQEQQRAQWTQELAQVEEEINTLRTVLASKSRLASDLKRKLGITVWKELTDDMNSGIKSVKESSVYQTVEKNVGDIAKAVHDAPLYQRTESVFKSTAEKTTSIFGDITSGITSKLSQMKNSESMRSIEERVGSAYGNVKTKVTTSRSGSIASFNDALHDNNTSSGLNSPTDSQGKQ